MVEYNKQNILIIDDIAENIDILHRNLCNEYKVNVVSNCDSAIKLLNSNNPPDLILFNVVLAGPNSPELCRKLKAKSGTDIPIIFITGVEKNENETILLESGAADYITEPINPPIAKSRIKTHLGLKSAREMLENQRLLMESIVVKGTRKIVEQDNYLKEIIKEKELLIHEVHHRVMNNLQFLYSILSLQMDKYADEQLIELVREYKNRLHSMALIHRELYQSENYINVDLVKYIKRLMVHLCQTIGADARKIVLRTNSEDFKIDINLAIPCGLIINELITNYIKYIFRDDITQELQIIFSVDDSGFYQIIIRDKNVTLPADFCLNIEETDSFWKKLINILKQQIHGSIEIDVSNGLAFIVRFKKVDLNTYNKLYVS